MWKKKEGRISCVSGLPIDCIVVQKLTKDTDCNDSLNVLMFRRISCCMKHESGRLIICECYETFEPGYTGFLHFGLSLLANMFAWYVRVIYFPKLCTVVLPSSAVVVLQDFSQPRSGSITSPIRLGWGQVGAVSTRECANMRISLILHTGPYGRSCLCVVAFVIREWYFCHSWKPFNHRL